MSKEVTSAVFKQDGNEDDLKELLMFVHKKFSLIILMEMSEIWDALFLSNVIMSFFMSSMLTSEKQNVWWSLYLKIALRLGSAMFSITGSNSLYL